MDSEIKYEIIHFLRKVSSKLNWINLNLIELGVHSLGFNIQWSYFFEHLIWYRDQGAKSM